MLKKKYAFTLTEVLIAVAIVGIIAGMVLPKVVKSYQKEAMNSAFKREVQTIEDSINSLAVSENKSDFFSTMMYKDAEPENYEDSSELYMKKYLKTSKMCDNPKDCFAETYYEYEAGKKREEYKPDYKGSCAILKNGMSICMIPQIGAADITGIIDCIASKTRVGLNQDTERVKVTEWNNIAGDNTPSGSDDACDTDPNSLGCCQTKTISDPSDPCCTYEEIKNNNPQCLKHEIIEVERNVIPNYCHDTGCSNISLSVYYSVRGIEQGRRLSYSYTSNTYKNGKITYSKTYNVNGKSSMNLSLLINDYNNHPKNIKEFVKYNNFSGWLHANAKIKINIDGYETNLKDGAVLKTPSAIYM